MDEVGPPTVRELISELARIEDDLRADRGCHQGIAAADRPMLRCGSCSPLRGRVIQADGAAVHRRTVALPGGDVIPDPHGRPRLSRTGPAGGRRAARRSGRPGAGTDRPAR